MPAAGVEPARYRYQRILSPSRLPIPSRRRTVIVYHISSCLSMPRSIYFNRGRDKRSTGERRFRYSPAVFIQSIHRFLDPLGSGIQLSPIHFLALTATIPAMLRKAQAPCSRDPWSLHGSVHYAEGLPNRLSSD